MSPLRYSASPETTWERLAPLLPTVGITRLADVTRLDTVGIPVYEARRPLSRTISVFFGKGPTRAQARVSAVMEAMELYHVERIAQPVHRAALHEVARALGYDIRALDCALPGVINDDLVLDWIDAVNLIDGTTTLIPLDYVRQDSTYELAWDPPVFNTTNNGVAGGANRDEALISALCELIEREACTRTAELEPAARRRITISSLTGGGADLLARFEAAGNLVRIIDCTDVLDVPAFTALIWSARHPLWISGFGCDIDPDHAVSRALCEAAQGRLSVISGMSDDVSARARELLFRASTPGHADADSGDAMSPPRDLGILDQPTAVTALATRLADYTGHGPVVIDLTREDLGIPMVKVVVPGLAPLREEG